MKPMTDKSHSLDKGNAMWLLLIIMLTIVPGIDRATVLNTFESYDTCKPERDRIGFEMAEAYPGENDFLIVCEFRQDSSERHVHSPPSQKNRAGTDTQWDRLTLNGIEGDTLRSDLHPLNQASSGVRFASSGPSPRT